MTIDTNGETCTSTIWRDYKIGKGKKAHKWQWKAVDWREQCDAVVHSWFHHTLHVVDKWVSVQRASVKFLFPTWVQ